MSSLSLAGKGALAIVVIALCASCGRSRFADSRCPNEPVSTTPSGSIFDLELSNSSERLYAVTAAGALYVSDDGSRWRESPSRAPESGVTVLGERSDLLLSGTGKGLFVSRNEGRSWRNLACGWDVSQIAGIPKYAKTIYVSTTTPREDSEEGLGLYTTSDGGVSWKKITSLSNYDISSLAVGPKSPRVVYLGTENGGLYMSDDGGEHWRFNEIQSVGGGLDGPTVFSIGFNAGRPSTLWVGSQLEGVFSSEDNGEHWSRRGLRGQSVYEIIPDPTSQNIVYAVTDGKGVLRTTDGGRNWRSMRGLPRSAIVLILRAKDNTLYSWVGRTVFVSRDHGTTWQRLSSLPPLKAGSRLGQTVVRDEPRLKR